MPKIQSVQSVIPPKNIFEIQNESKQVEQSFGTYLKEAIAQVDQMQKVSDFKTGQLITGQNVDLHNVMIEAQKANIALSATLEIRNKVVEAYQEISRMPL
ncbi:flagellar hook-basal body complex protein FliE [Savagea faecisuis]|uniref:Flagellar hook-basal body complex protein FliE n=1 Tax=Savagea faecisuis TaxID=1274803 RepID=A0ABW3GX89_9BACL